VAYRTQVQPRDKAVAIAAVVAIHAALLLAFLNLAGAMNAPAREAAFHVFDLAQPPTPPPPPHRRQQSRLTEKVGGSAPKNVRSKATPVVAPKPVIRLPPIQHIAASATPRAGTAPTQGAAEVVGPGTGAGGTGNGTGSGTGGSGSGAGGGIAEPPRLATPVLRGPDFPSSLLEQWPRGATVFMRLRIDARGNVAECMIDRGSGVPQIDGTLCNVAHDRLRFRPALDRSGQAVAGWFGYAQPAPR
jgi:periplasmic protein TonB